MLGREIIVHIDGKFHTNYGPSWEDWEKFKEEIYPDHDYPLKNFNISGRDFKALIRNEKLKILLKDVC